MTCVNQRGEGQRHSLITLKASVRIAVADTHNSFKISGLRKIAVRIKGSRWVE